MLQEVTLELMLLGTSTDASDRSDVTTRNQLSNKQVSGREHGAADLGCELLCYVGRATHLPVLRGSAATAASCLTSKCAWCFVGDDMGYIICLLAFWSRLHLYVALTGFAAILCTALSTFQGGLCHMCSTAREHMDANQSDKCHKINWISV